MDSFAGVTSYDVDLPSGRIRYYRVGSSGPPLVLLHGAVLDSAELAWGEVIPRLSGKFRIYAFDWPEHGYSWPAADGTSEAVLSDVLSRMVTYWGLERFHLVGSSQGGGIATRFALDHPEQVRRMIAIGPVGYDDRKLVLGVMSLVVRIPGLARLATRLMARFPGLVRLSLLVARTQRKKTLGFEESVQLGWQQVRRAVRYGSTILDDYLVESYERSKTRIDYLPQVGELTVPTLIVYGSKDLSTSERALRRAAAAMPNGTFRRVNGVGHMACRDDPQAIADLILGFLREDEGASG